MAEALTRVPSADVATKVLTNIIANGFSLVFYYSDGSSHSEDVEPYIDSLIQSVENTVAANIETIVTASSVVNPVVGQEKNGDVRVSNNIASIYVNGAWIQVWPL